MLLWYSLTRRFSVLRNSAGEPIGLDDIKSKLAEQRARGAENKVSEEEEDMILEALSRLRTKGSTERRDVMGSIGGSQDERVLSGYSESGSRISESLSFTGQSVRSTTTASSAFHDSPSTASLSSAKGSQASRRMSNNLFGSGKFHDHTYMRTAYQRRAALSSSAGSPAVKDNEPNTSMSTITSSRIGPSNSVYSDTQSLRPVTPDGSSAYGSSVPSSPNRATHETETDIDAQLDFSRTLVPEILGRASLALDEAIRELEEEGDDEIVMERSPISSTPLISPGKLFQPLVRAQKQCSSM
jgi:serine/arginine repetitive matrix protein 2